MIIKNKRQSRTVRIIFFVFNSSSLRTKKIMYREAVFFCSTSGHGCVHTYCPYFGKTADCTNASASVHWPWFSKKNLQPQGLQIFFREPWPKYKSFGIVQSLVFPKLGQVLIVLQHTIFYIFLQVCLKIT